MIRDQEALDYHTGAKKGKIEVVATKPCTTQRELSLAYTPGVAVPCRVIEKDPSQVFQYTAKGNLVAVISNCTAVLGLGDIGPLAGKPVMEGKGVLFKRFADVDVFDIEMNTHDPDEFIQAVKLMEPTFGGINLEDIKAPECFYIEERLKELMNIPVFHDDQHGTAIISGAALLNALELVDKKIEDVKVVFNGAGAAGTACAKFYVSLGVRPENLFLCDSKGVIYKGRKKGMNPYKEQFAQETDARTLADIIRGADVFAGMSVADCVTKDMVRSMAKDPIIFAMANPDPEITYEDAKAARSDVIMATGRSDYPNQVNNVLGFPFIFRGALDVRATAINESMKRAAAHALADLAKEDVPDSVMKAYGVERLRFGREYLIPKPFDYRVLIWEASAVAQAAIESGVAGIKMDMDEYREQLEKRLGKSREVMHIIIHQAKRAPNRVVFPEGTNDTVLRASQMIMDEGVARPILLGKEGVIREKIRDLDLNLNDVRIVEPRKSDRYEAYVNEFFEIRKRKGVTLAEARDLVAAPTVFASLMVRMGDADALLAGVTQHYPETLRPALQVIPLQEGVSRAAGLYMMIVKEKVYFFADPTVNIDPSAEQLAEIAICSAQVARRFHVEPRVAMISFSNFGSVRHPFVEKVQRATEIVKQREPELRVDGEMQVDTALVPEIQETHYPFNTLKGEANVLVFPDLQSANAAYKLVYRLGCGEAIGPILMGLSKPVHVLEHGCDVRDIVNMAAFATVDAQDRATVSAPKKAKKR